MHFDILTSLHCKYYERCRYDPGGIVQFPIITIFCYSLIVSLIRPIPKMPLTSIVEIYCTRILYLFQDLKNH